MREIYLYNFSFFAASFQKIHSRARANGQFLNYEAKLGS